MVTWQCTTSSGGGEGEGAGEGEGEGEDKQSSLRAAGAALASLTIASATSTFSFSAEHGARELKGADSEETTDTAAAAAMLQLQPLLDGVDAFVVAADYGARELHQPTIIEPAGIFVLVALSLLVLVDAAVDLQRYPRLEAATAIAIRQFCVRVYFLIRGVVRITHQQHPCMYADMLPRLTTTECAQRAVRIAFDTPYWWVLVALVRKNALVFCAIFTFTTIVCPR